MNEYGTYMPVYNMTELSGRVETLAYLFCNYFSEDYFSVNLTSSVENKKLYMPKGQNKIWQLAFETGVEAKIIRCAFNNNIEKEIIYENN